MLPANAAGWLPGFEGDTKRQGFDSGNHQTMSHLLQIVDGRALFHTLEC